MEILWILCKAIALIVSIMFGLTILYAIISTFVQNILRDCKNIKKYQELKSDYEQLLKKVERLEIELVDKEINK